MGWSEASSVFKWENDDPRIAATCPHFQSAKTLGMATPSIPKGRIRAHTQDPALYLVKITCEKGLNDEEGAGLTGPGVARPLAWWSRV